MATAAQRILYPLQAFFNVAPTLPKLPTGLSYADPLIGGVGAPSIAAAQTMLTSQIATTGLDVVQAAPFTKSNPLKDILTGIFQSVSVGSSPGSLAAGTAKGLLTPDQTTSLMPVTHVGGGSMGLFDSIFGSGSTDTTGTTGGGFSFGQGIDWTSLLNTVTPIATNFIQGGFGQPQAAAPAALAGAVPAVVTGGAVAVARGFAMRFPNLAASMARFRAAGQKVSRAKLYSMMKRFGPAFLVNGGLLTAAAVNELALAGPGRRRMNPANSRALSRAARRIRSFHKLCRHTDLLRSHGRRYTSKRS